MYRDRLHISPPPNQVKQYPISTRVKSPQSYFRNKVPDAYRSVTEDQFSSFDIGWHVSTAENCRKPLSVRRGVYGDDAQRLIMEFVLSTEELRSWFCVFEQKYDHEDLLEYVMFMKEEQLASGSLGYLKRLERNLHWRIPREEHALVWPQMLNYGLQDEFLHERANRFPDSVKAAQNKGLTLYPHPLNDAELLSSRIFYLELASMHARIDDYIFPKEGTSDVVPRNRLRAPRLKFWNVLLALLTRTKASVRVRTFEEVLTSSVKVLPSYSEACLETSAYSKSYLV